MEGPGNPGEIHTPNQVCSGTVAHQYVYLQVKGEFGLALPPNLFAKDVIAGIYITQTMADENPEPPLGIYLLSEKEVVIEVSEKLDLSRLTVSLAALEMWIRQKVQVVCRAATPDEVEHVKRRDEEPEDPLDPFGGQDAKLLRMMEDIHKLTASPNGEALRIPTFSGSIPPGKKEATFAQWIHEVRDAQNQLPESTVRNWISRSLLGPPADAVRSLGPYVSVATILNKLETMHGAVAPFDVMMRKLFNIGQNKGESVTNFAIRVETILTNIQRDHPRQMTDASMKASRRDRFYQGLKKSYKESLRYLYDTGAPYEAILRAARKAEAEAEHYKDTDPAPSKVAHSDNSGILDELASLKAAFKKAMTTQQQQQKQGNQGELKQPREEDLTNNPRKDQEDPAMAVEEQDTSLEIAQTSRRSL